MEYFKKVQTETGFKFSQYSNQTILSTSFVVLSQHLIQEKIENKHEIIEYLLRARNTQGYFIDPNYKYHNHPEHDSNYVIPQFTFFTLSALDVLGIKNLELPFLNDFNDQKLIVELGKSLEKNFWATSNQLMFLMYFITYKIRYLEEVDYNRFMDHIFKFLNRNQNTENGFWGNDLTTKSIYAKAYGAAHIYLFYDFFKREIPFTKKIIDNCLSMHTETGLIQTLEGGACEDYDIIEIYFRCLKQTDYRKEEVLEMLYKMKKTLLKNKKRDDGFSYKAYSKNNLQRILDRRVKGQKYRYSSWDYMETPIYLSDTWGTFFRHLSLKLIDDLVEGKKEYNSASLPTWGYIL